MAFWQVPLRFCQQVSGVSCPAALSLLCHLWHELLGHRLPMSGVSCLFWCVFKRTTTLSVDTFCTAIGIDIAFIWQISQPHAHDCCTTCPTQQQRPKNPWHESRRIVHNHYDHARRILHHLRCWLHTIRWTVGRRKPRFLRPSFVQFLHFPDALQSLAIG